MGSGSRAVLEAIATEAERRQRCEGVEVRRTDWALALRTSFYNHRPPGGRGAVLPSGKPHAFPSKTAAQAFPD